MTGSDKSRKKFVENLKLFKKKLDGVDYNWEYPGHWSRDGLQRKRAFLENGGV